MKSKSVLLACECGKSRISHEASLQIFDHVQSICEFSVSVVPYSKVFHSVGGGLLGSTLDDKKKAS